MSSETKKKKSKKKMLRLVVIILSCLVIIGAACYTLFIAPNISQEEIVYKEYAVEYGKLQNSVSESGTVSFGITSEVYDLDISTENDDDDDDEEEEEERYLKVEQVFVSKGQRIEKGDPIYKFTEDSITDVRKALTYAKTEAQIALAQADTEYRIGLTTAKLSKDETLLKSSQAQEKYNVTVAKLYNDMAVNTLKIEQLLVEIHSLQESLVEDSYREQGENVSKEYDEAVKALEDASDQYFTVKVAANESFRKARESYERYFDQYDQSNDKINDKIKEVTSLQEKILKTQQLISKDLLTASQTLETSIVGGDIADNKYASSIEKYENNVKSTTQKLEEATEKLDDFNTFVGDGIVYSTGTGIITEMGYEVDDYLVRAGTMFSYATYDDMTISVDVSQEDVVAMSVGDSVKIGFSAYEGEEYEGIIKSITTTATSRSSATISYPVVITILGDTTKLFDGMTADVTFVIEESQDIVYVSRKAIVENNSRKYVYTKNKGDYVLTPVTTGDSYGEYIEITSGLSVGDNYYVKSVKIKDDNKANSSADTKSEVKDNIPGSGFDGGQMPQGFDGGQMPQGFDGGQMPQGFGGGQNMPAFDGKGQGGGFRP